MTNYNLIFDAFESSLFRHSKLPEAELRQELDAFKIDATTTFSDEAYYEKIVMAIFYSGMRADTVTGRWPTIKRYFPDWQTAAAYSEDNIELMMDNPAMLRNRRKIMYAVKNAREFKEIVGQYGSFANYLSSFRALDSFENLMLLKEVLQDRMAGLGPIMTFHFMTDISLPVLKPDRVICRIFQRLGLIADEGQLLEAVIQGRNFAVETGQPIRYIDIIFVIFGQIASVDLGI
jgi:DNA-3-methyladenine glycosylase I